MPKLSSFEYRRKKIEKMTPVTLTDKAIAQIKAIRASKEIPEAYGLRIGVKGAGCAGVSYLLGFDTKKQNDSMYEIGGLTIFLAKKDTMYLIGLEVDYYEGAEATGFTFVNPEQK
ncbi:MAG: HesB/IscA family protein [Cyclobacteriaceae bacterium]